MLILDTSALVPLFVMERRTHAVRTFLAVERPELVISSLVSAEFSAAISNRMRTGTFDGEMTMQLLRSFDRWSLGNAARVDVMPLDIRRADVFVRQFHLKLRAPDAIHLAVCARVGGQLLTFDDIMAAAAVALDIPLRSISEA
jgi:uncharacterized protein